MSGGKVSGGKVSYTDGTLSFTPGKFRLLILSTYKAKKF